MCENNDDIVSIGGFYEEDFATITDGTLVIHRINGKDRAILVRDDEADFMLDALIKFVESKEGR